MINYILYISIKSLLLHDNAPVHKALVAKVFLRNFGYEELLHPPYSSDMTLCDFTCFPTWKNTSLWSTFFLDDNEIMIP